MAFAEGDGRVSWAGNDKEYRLIPIEEIREKTLKEWVKLSLYLIYIFLIFPNCDVFVALSESLTMVCT